MMAPACNVEGSAYFALTLSLLYVMIIITTNCSLYNSQYFKKRYENCTFIRFVYKKEKIAKKTAGPHDQTHDKKTPYGSLSNSSHWSTFP